jgi:hypothetical protein
MMHTLALTPTFSHPFGRRGLIVGAGALVVTATLFLGLAGAPDESSYAANREVEMHVARVPVQNLDELTKQSNAVVVGRVVSKGATKMIVPTSQQARPFTGAAIPSDIGKDKASQIKTTSEVSRNQPNIITPPAGLPMTEYTLEVSQVLSGKLAKGSKVTVNQMGGEILIPLGDGAPTLHRTMVAEHDPLLVPGQEQVLFLTKEAGGTYHITGGPDGRFNLDAKKSLQPVDEGSPVGKAHKGHSIDDLQNNINQTGRNAN